jgi:hypothetical protein
MEPELHILCRFVVGLFPLPLLYRALRRLHEQRIPTLDLYRFDRAVCEHERCQFDGPSQIHAAGDIRIFGNDLGHYFPRACGFIVLRRRSPNLKRGNYECQKYQEQRGTFHNVYKVNITRGYDKLRQ